MYTELATRFQPKYEPRLIIAWMRLQYGTLDHLDIATWKREAKIAADCIDADKEASEQLAKSYGLLPK